jgi:hypothetical protein
MHSYIDEFQFVDDSAALAAGRVAFAASVPYIARSLMKKLIFPIRAAPAVLPKHVTLARMLLGC